MKVLITGAAGFIGSNVVDSFLAQGAKVTGIDNLSTGQKEFLSDASKNKNFSLFESDLLDFDATKDILAHDKPDLVLHFAANADVRFGLQATRRDLEQGTIVTYNVLESARLAGVKQFAFSSTGSIYGEAKVFPTPEDCPFPIQTSLYGASKLAAEGLVQAYAEGFGMKCSIFRFVSILGPRYTHGHVYDFLNKIQENPKAIEVLGDGTQTKAYLHIEDCVSAIQHIVRNQKEKVSVFNLGPDEYITVNQSLDVICNFLGANPERKYTGGNRGWVGDSPFIFLDCNKLKSIGWKAKHSIKESVESTLRYLLDNKWVLERRKV